VDRLVKKRLDGDAECSLFAHDERLRVPDLGMVGDMVEGIVTSDLFGG
jgi:hypothetical protein